MGPLSLESLGEQLKHRETNTCWNAENAIGTDVQARKLYILGRFGALGAECKGLVVVRSHVGMEQEPSPPPRDRVAKDTVITIQHS